MTPIRTDTTTAAVPAPVRSQRDAVRLAAAALLVVLAAGCATEPRFDGPIASRNQHPAQLLVGRLPTRSAEATAAGRARVELRSAYSSLFLGERSDGDALDLDGEFLRTALTTRLGLGGGVDVQVDLPIAHASGGFLDDFVVAWHESLGLPDQGREAFPRDEFVVRAVNDGASALEVKPHGLRLMDVPVVLSWAPAQLSDAQPVGVMLRGGVDLPIGDEDAGYGSGRPEWMVGAVFELRTGPVAWNAHAEHTWAASPSTARAADFRFADVTSLGVGAEIALSDSWSLLAQVEMDQSTLRGLDLTRASDDQWLLWSAARWRIADRFRLETGIGEDLSSFVAPDFTVWLALSFDFGS